MLGTLFNRSNYLAGRSMRIFPALRCLAIAWIAILAACLPARADVVSLTSAQDTYISLKNPTTNFSTTISMIVDRETTDLQRALVQFDLSSIPAGSTVTSAVLKLQATQVGGSITVRVYGLLGTLRPEAAQLERAVMSTTRARAGAASMRRRSRPSQPIPPDSTVTP